MFYITLQSPVGELYIAEESGKIVFISFEKANVEKGREKQTPLLLLAERQLTEYFDGARKTFDLPLNPSGTEFYKRVWKALEEIPYGETRSINRSPRRWARPRRVGRWAAPITTTQSSSFFPVTASSERRES